MLVLQLRMGLFWQTKFCYLSQLQQKNSYKGGAPIMSISRIVEDAFRETVIKMHVEKREEWHDFLKRDGAISCFVCGKTFKEAVQ